MKVLVTGGTGLIGSAIQKYRPDWIYIGSKDGNLTNFEEVKNILEKHKPDTIIHLAANVGGLFKNISNRLEMFNSNIIINYNVLENAYKQGIKRVICCLSTCIFPDGLKRILKEEDLHLGEPHNSNYGYAYAKRIMEVQCRLYNQSGTDCYYQCIIPTNVYGPNDNFNLYNGHIIPGLIHKAYIYSQSSNKTEPFTILGTGLPKRQFIYSYDLAKIIINLLLNNIAEPLLICSSPESDEVTILDVAKIIANHFNITNIKTEISEEGHGVVTFGHVSDGQQIKTVSPAKLLKIMPNLELTGLETGITDTIKWFLQSYPNVRK
jgi:GDP-L-fucose synthase